MLFIFHVQFFLAYLGYVSNLRWFVLTVFATEINLQNVCQNSNSNHNHIRNYVLVYQNLLLFLVQCYVFRNTHANWNIQCLHVLFEYQNHFFVRQKYLRTKYFFFRFKSNILISYFQQDHSIFVLIWLVQKFEWIFLFVFKCFLKT